MFSRWVAILLLAVLFVSPLCVSNVSSQSPNCSNVLVIFARGSGQPQGEDDEDLVRKKERVSFFDGIKERAPNGVTVETRELVYPAEGAQSKISGFPLWLDAEVPWLGIGKYYGSKNSGITNLKNLLGQQAVDCPNQKFVLGGYSQGAHVVGDTLFQLGSNIKNQIVYVGLFGDPKFKADSYSARGSFLRRSGGILEARPTDFPVDFMGKLQSWCKAGDGICENNFLVEALPGNLTLHNSYPTHEIPIATNYAAQLLKQYFSGFQPKPMGGGALGDKVDVVYVVDTTATMQGVLGNVRANINSLTNQTLALGTDTKLGLVQYNDTKDGCGVKQPRTELDLTNDATLLPARFANLFGECGGSPGDDTYSGLMTALSGQSWRTDARKLIILLAGNTPNSPDKFNAGAGEASVVTTARSLGVNIHGVIRGNSSIQILAHLNLLGDTGGHGLFMPPGVTSEFMRMHDYISQLLIFIPNLPVADLQKPKPAQPGQSITFNGSNSYDPNGTIVKYEWDFDNNGTYDLVSDQGIVRHTYAAAYSGSVVLRVTSSDNGINYASTAISVSASNPLLSVPNKPVNPIASLHNDNTITLSWQPPASSSTFGLSAQSPTIEAYRILLDGESIGMVSADTTSIKISDISLNGHLSFGIAAINSEGQSETTDFNFIANLIEKNIEQPSPGNGFIASSSSGGGSVTTGVVTVGTILNDFLGTESSSLQEYNSVSPDKPKTDPIPSDLPIKPTKLVWLLLTLPLILRAFPLIRLTRSL